MFILVFILQVINSYFRSLQISSIANKQRWKSMFAIFCFTVVFLISTYLGVKAVDDNDYLVCIAYIAGNVVGNDLVFIKKSK